MSQRARCDFTGCNRYARPGYNRCTNHRKEVDRQGKPPNPLERAIASNNYGKLTPQVMQAAADHEGVDNEISLLRIVMQDLLDNEPDASKRAAGIAKLAGTVIQAMRAKRTLSGTAADEFTDAVSLILEELT